MFLSQSTREITGCNDPPESPSSITCVMYAVISTANPFLTQTDGPAAAEMSLADFCARYSVDAATRQIERVPSDLDLYRFYRKPRKICLARCLRHVASGRDTIRHSRQGSLMINRRLLSADCLATRQTRCDPTRCTDNKVRRPRRFRAL